MRKLNHSCRWDMCESLHTLCLHTEPAQLELSFPPSIHKRKKKSVMSKKATWVSLRHTWLYVMHLSPKVTRPCRQKAYLRSHDTLWSREWISYSLLNIMDVEKYRGKSIKENKINIKILSSKFFKCHTHLKKFILSLWRGALSIRN